MTMGHMVLLTKLTNQLTDKLSVISYYYRNNLFQQLIYFILSSFEPVSFDFYFDTPVFPPSLILPLGCPMSPIRFTWCLMFHLSLSHLY